MARDRQKHDQRSGQLIDHLTRHCEKTVWNSTVRLVVPALPNSNSISQNDPEHQAAGAKRAINIKYTIIAGCPAKNFVLILSNQKT